MALVSGGGSTLNPNAPLFVPAAFRQVEDFSPEWWQLVTTLTWYHDFWLSQQQDVGDNYYSNGSEDDGFVGDDVVELLPDSFDLVGAVEEDPAVYEEQLEDFMRFSREAHEEAYYKLTA